MTITVTPKHKAIMDVYANVTDISEIDGVITAYDSNGDVVSIDLDSTAVVDKIAEVNTAYNLQKLRAERNFRLAETDWWASSDLTMTQAQTDYRQALRDITNTYQSMEDEGFSFPEKPTE